VDAAGTSQRADLVVATDGCPPVEHRVARQAVQQVVLDFGPDEIERAIVESTVSVKRVDVPRRASRSS
jgi:hypothetical protein